MHLHMGVSQWAFKFSEVATYCVLKYAGHLQALSMPIAEMSQVQCDGKYASLTLVLQLKGKRGALLPGNLPCGAMSDTDFSGYLFALWLQLIIHVSHRAVASSEQKEGRTKLPVKPLGCLADSVQRAKVTRICEIGHVRPGDHFLDRCSWLAECPGNSGAVPAV